MLYTCSYNNFNTNYYKGVSISGDRGKSVSFKSAYYSDLAPKKKFFKVWKNNIGKISDIDNNTYYIREYYKQILSNLDPLKVYNDLYNSFLLCYEEPHEFCHRHIVSYWLELLLDKKIKEVKVSDMSIIEVDKPEYIKEILESVMKENIDMKGFNSLRAMYLFNLAVDLENDAIYKESKYNKNFDFMKQASVLLRHEAEIIEKEYNNKFVKKLIKDE